jgi:hypothetical protein
LQAAAAGTTQGATFRANLAACLDAWTPQDLSLMHAACEAEALLEVAVHALLQVGTCKPLYAAACWPVR